MEKQLIDAFTAISAGVANGSIDGGMAQRALYRAIKGKGNAQVVKYVKLALNPSLVKAEQAKAEEAQRRAFLRLKAKFEGATA